MTFTPFAALPALAAAPLTVRAQARYDLRDNLTFPAFFTETDVDSMKVSEATTAEFLQLADRRAWDTDPGRLTYTKGDAANYSFVPIGLEDGISEEEIQDIYTLLSNPALRQQAIEQRLVISVPERIDKMVDATRRRLNLDATEAWAYGTHTVRNRLVPAEVLTMRIVPADRYLTAATAWDNGAVNAFALCVAFLKGARLRGIDVAGLRLTTGILNAITDDAPANPLTGALGQEEVERLISSKVGIGSFRFSVADVEPGYETINPLTKVKTMVPYWPAGRAAVIPRGTAVGQMRYAPIVRASDIAAQVPEARINERRIAAFVGDEGLMGKALKIETQLNAFPFPDQDKIYVIDTGVAG